jgi:hypothetical protein
MTEVAMKMVQLMAVVEMVKKSAIGDFERCGKAHWTSKGNKMSLRYLGDGGYAACMVCNRIV